ncbi:DUF397 domain-containing protein [Lentzea terrae]|uniref:DUF397 domain-containing protein n=1 Tax=Lentzea terrae TaxID=2200761 RepID=UPI002FCD9B47
MRKNRESGYPSTRPEGAPGMWRKSSYSANAMDCVEIGRGIGIRDSKAPSAQLSLSADAWSAFLRAIKSNA